MSPQWPLLDYKYTHKRSHTQATVSMADACACPYARRELRARVHVSFCESVMPTVRLQTERRSRAFTLFVYYSTRVIIAVRHWHFVSLRLRSSVIDLGAYALPRAAVTCDLLTKNLSSVASTEATRQIDSLLINRLYCEAHVSADTR